MANISDTVLIYSAGFGDGHNSAARNVSASIRELSGGEVQAPVLDLFEESVPRLGAFLKWGYGFLTTRVPWGWKLLYDHAEKTDSSKLGWDWFGGMHGRMTRHLAQHRPGGIISTFPLYPHLLADGHPGVPQPRGTFTVITDSITINSVWWKGPTDRFFVADEFSAAVLQDRGISQGKITVSGFAVPPIFSRLMPRPAAAAAQDFRVLFFVTSETRMARRALDSLLRHLPAQAKLTLVTGRHEQRLRPVLAEMLQWFPHRNVEMLGWVKNVPELLVGHDLIISKGGGATVHESLASGTPLLVNHLIPGQEEGNAELLRRRGCGWFCDQPSELGPMVQHLLESGEWMATKQRCLASRKTTGATQIAREVLTHCWPEKSWEMR